MILYDKTSNLCHIDEARKEQFFQKGKTMEKLPPTQHALLQHVKQVAYQAGIWCTSEQSEQHAPAAEGWGWTLDKENQLWIPVWNTLPLASKACSELVKRNCKSERGCDARCGCKKANWQNYAVVIVKMLVLLDQFKISYILNANWKCTELCAVYIAYCVSPGVVPLICILIVVDI